MRNISILVLTLLCMGNNIAPSLFMKKVQYQRQKDSEILPTDTLFYIPYIMNLTSNRKWDKLSIPERRAQLFKVLSEKKLHFVYYSALDIGSGQIFHNPRGVMDYLEKKRQKIVFYPSNLELLDSAYLKKNTQLVNYIRQNKPEMIFTISEIDGIDFEVYWVIKNQELHVLQYGRTDSTISEFDHEPYINEIAPDYVFSSTMRLQIELEPYIE